MELALMTEPHVGGAAYADLAAAARWAEDQGLAAFARSDHYYRATPTAASDAFTTLGGIARETNRIRLVLLVSPITFRHPAVIAKSAASLDDMSGGRFDLGLGTGWMEAEHTAFGLPFPDLGERFSMLEDALAYVQTALRDDHASFSGDHYRLDAEVRPLAPGVGIVLGGSGPKRTPRLAAKWADEFNTFVKPVAEVATRVEAVRAAASEIGRDPSEIRMSVMGGVLVGDDLADYRERLAEWAAEEGREPAELEARLVERAVPHGTPDQAQAMIADLAAVGIDRYYAQVIPHDLTNVDRTLGPLLR